MKDARFMPSRYHYQAIVSNPYLGKTKVVKGMTQAEVQYEAGQQQQAWAKEEPRQARAGPATSPQVRIEGAGGAGQSRRAGPAHGFEPPLAARSVPQHAG